MRHWFRSGGRVLRATARGGAWLFIAGSVGFLAWAIVSLWNDPSEPAVMCRTVVGGQAHVAWGLSYLGTMGLIAAFVQALVVVAAVVASALPRATLARRIGHVVLCAWVGLWAFNLSRMASLSDLLLTTGLAAFFWLLAGCTVYRALAGWRGREVRPAV